MRAVANDGEVATLTLNGEVRNRRRVLRAQATHHHK